MRIFKFGGASVKDANGVRNLLRVLEHTGVDGILIVISAMGKTTNALERVVDSYFNHPQRFQNDLQKVFDFHYQILEGLFSNTGDPVYKELQKLKAELTDTFSKNRSPDYNFVYDQTIGFGELLSTTIVSHYLRSVGMENLWLDVRELIKTDSYYRRANVNWELTQQLITSRVPKARLCITQGFLGSDAHNFTTTLGREGSDYTAAIFGYCLNASTVTIWKDVPGVLNADPRYFKNSQLLHHISYTEAIELAFYGASVIHPKTLQPLQKKEIPLHVKSFIDPELKGTTVTKGRALDPQVPCFILKKDQVLISLSSLDFSYIVEENISDIFNLLHQYKMKVDVIQNSAISFSVCVDNVYNNLEALIQHLKARFKVKSYHKVDLYTIRHYNQKAIEEIERGKTILLKQLTRETVQIVAN
jgi:aspartate kinase